MAQRMEVSAERVTVEMFGAFAETMQQEMTTICGHVEVLRRRWMSAVGAGWQVPLDSWWGEAEGVVTTAVMSLVCLLSQGATSFQQAAECLHAATNNRLGQEKHRQL